MPNPAALALANATRWQNAKLTHNISQARLKELLNYDPETGVFRWLVKRGRLAKPGSIAGTEHKVKRSNSPYIRIKIDGRSYLAQRLAFLYMTGAWPASFPDHINADTLDNRWQNLRVATASQNQANRKVRKDNKCGVKGVFYIKRDKKYCAEIQINKKRVRLGYFENAEDAGVAYAEASKSLFGEFARAQ